MSSEMANEYCCDCGELTDETYYCAHCGEPMCRDCASLEIAVDKELLQEEGLVENFAGNRNTGLSLCRVCKGI